MGIKQTARRKVARRIAGIALALLAIGMTTAFSYGQTEDGKNVKVGLLFGNSAVASCVVTGETGLMIGQITAAGIEPVLPLPDYDWLTVIPEGTGLAVKDRGGALLSADIGANGVIAAYDAATGGIISVDGRVVRGGLCFSTNPNGTINVVNYLPLEEYIYGVLHNELGQSSPLEALKAQAVTARSYAVGMMGRHQDEGFDFCTTTHCQVYTGYEAEYPRTNQAVDETAGLVIAYDGIPVAGYFFKNSGGHTQSAEDVWGGRLPYAVGVRDAHSPAYAWRYALTFSEISSRLESSGLGIGTVQRVTITQRHASSAVAAIDFEGTRGTATLKGEQIRSVFGFENMRSTMFFLGEAQSDGAGGAEDGSLRASDGNTTVQFDAEALFFAIGADGVAVRRVPEGVYAWSREGKRRIGAIPGGAGGFAGTGQIRDEPVTAEPVVFSGNGYGHGVGMPQDSAIQMAEHGFTYAEILEYYYTDISFLFQ